jgi:hypothetical protein
MTMFLYLNHVQLLSCRFSDQNSNIQSSMQCKHKQMTQKKSIYKNSTTITQYKSIYSSTYDVVYTQPYSLPIQMNWPEQFLIYKEAIAFCTSGNIEHPTKFFQK